MSFVPNTAQQLSLFDQMSFMSDRKLKMLQKSWAQAFSDHVFTKINEQIFAPLYSEKMNSRPNAPVNVIVGALILRDFSGMTDEEITECCEFDYRYQCALHTTSFKDQPISDRTFSRFRERCAAYKLVTGRDLVHECFVELSDEMRRYMEISPQLKRMDSMMIESHIRKLGRLELMYTCISNLVKALERDGHTELVGDLKHYAEDNDRNRVIYHDKETPLSERFQTAVNDAAKLLPKCAGDYSGTEEYQLLERALEEQTKKDDQGNHIPRGKGEGFHSSILQNPSDPDATYREKAGKSHVGYVANLTEAVDKNGSIVTDYQYDVNTHSDQEFLKEVIDNTPEEEAQGTTYVADGAYNSKELDKAASEKGITIINTGLAGRKPRMILDRFRLAEDEKKILSCPAGNAPKASSYISRTNTIRASLRIEQCMNCPHREECRMHLKKRTAYILFSVDALHRARREKERLTDERLKLMYRVRNGVETLPSILRRKYHVDKMPVRRKLRTEMFFSFKLYALNFNKLYRYIHQKEKCRPLAAEE